MVGKQTMTPSPICRRTIRPIAGSGSGGSIPWFSTRREIGQRSIEEARALALGEAECLWHERYGQRPDPRSCAGCGKPIGQSALFALPDGARVHDDAGLACLIAYGHRWRTAAVEALRALGIYLTHP